MAELPRIIPGSPAFFCCDRTLPDAALSVLSLLAPTLTGNEGCLGAAASFRDLFAGIERDMATKGGSHEQTDKDAVSPDVRIIPSITAYADLKFGAKFKKVPVGIGVEGSVEILIQTKTQTGVEAITTLKNREPTNSADPSRVDEFHLMGYWLKPSEKGYLVPENRKDMGDAPWFITYRVTDYWP